MKFWDSAHPNHHAPTESGLKDTGEIFRKHRYVLSHPRVRKGLYRGAGVPFSDPWTWIKSSFGGYRTGFVPGAGSGDHCRMILDLGIADKVVAVDISLETIKKSQEIFQKMGYAIDYVYGDLNFIKRMRLDYDVCISMHAFHHVVDLENLFSTIRKTLSKQSKGALIFEEYVGPRYLEYPEPIKKLANAMFERMPKRLRRTIAGEVLDRIPFRNRWHTQKQTPFESIRSDAIPSIYLDVFEPTEYFELGGALIAPVLENFIHNFDETDEEANGVIDDLLETDRRMTNSGSIPTFYLLTSGEPRHL
jgi:SAM-dependent methyltransferase